MKKQRGKVGRLSPKFIGPGLFLFALSLVAVPTLVRAWTEPSSPPGTYTNDPSTLRDTFRFLNASSATQQKLGTLVIGAIGDTAKLCLNSNPNFPANDTTNCITSWDDLRNSPYLHLGRNNAGSDIAQYNDYSTGPLISIKNDPTANQRYSFIAEANPTIVGSTAVTAYSYIPGAGYIDYKYAAYLSGSTFVGKSDWSSNYGLCLNSTATAGTITVGSSSKGCITKWSDLYFSSSGQAYVQLATSGASNTPQDGQISVTHSMSSGSLVVGSTAGLPLAYTCGDAICSSNTAPAETSSSCPIDCAGVYNITTFLAYPSVNKVFFDTKSWPNNVTQRVIILRQEGSAPTSAPQDGTTYSVGQRIGDATVIYAGSTLWGPNESFFNTDATALNGRTYYYVAYASNSMPRYGSPTAVVSATPQAATAQVNLSFTYNNAVSIDLLEETFGGLSPLAPVSCNTSCTRNFVPGSRVTLSTDALTIGYTLNGYTGSCTSTGTSCTFTVTNGANIQVVLTHTPPGQGGGGGGGGRQVF